MTDKGKMIEDVRALIEEFEAGDTLPLVKEILDVIEGSDWFDDRMARKFQQGVDMGLLGSDRPMMAGKDE